MTRLLFQGDLSLTIAVAVATAVAIVVAWYYRRETRSLDPPLAWVLPLLRGAAILITLLMLAGPVVQHRTVIGSVARVDVYIDTSGSMLADDEPQQTAAADHGEPSPGGTAAGEPADGAPMRDSPASVQPTRLQRASRLLLGGGAHSGWIESVRSTHHVYLHALVGNRSRLIWDSQSDLPLPQSVEHDPETTGGMTNLSDPIAAGVLGSEADAAMPDSAEDVVAVPTRSGPRRAVLLLSDGQHNAGPPPQPLAQRLGDAAIAIYAIGVGSPQEPRDVAVLGVDAPPSVSASGRASGWIAIKDIAGEGEQLRVRILMGDQTVWQQNLTSENQLLRRIPFDFPVAPWVEQLHGRDVGGIERTRVTLPLRAVIDPIEGQYDAGNNQFPFRLAANLRQRRLLIVDSRARWETRYLRNLFDRDPTWQVETVLAWPRLPSGRGDRQLSEGTFPPDSQSMASFDAVIWGDVGADAFSTDDLRRLREFAAQGGAVVFIDGDRDQLLALRETPLGPLLPVRLNDGPLLAGVRSLIPTTIGGQQAALRLATEAHDESTGGDDNLTTWSQLPPPTTLRRAEVLPGSEVWLEATVDSDPAAPVLVTRLFGGGQIVYLATDQTWRWRYRVADRYHARFWNQLLEAIMQPPFEVRDQYVALATGAPQYTAGEMAPIRVRLRDAEGKSVGDAIVEAVLQDRSGASQTVLLHRLDTDRGVYEGRTEPLAAGEYEVSVRAAGYQSSQAVKTSLLVVPPRDRETARLALNADLLQSMAEASGGVYADEAEADRVWRAINPLSDGRIEIRRFELAQSFLWFFAVLGLLTAEWWLRKRAGLV